MRVLVVDDSPSVRGRLVALLGETVPIDAIREAHDGDEALALLATYAADLVVLDLHMPKVGGLAVLPRLKARRPPPVVVVLTNHPTEHHRRECLAHGADYFFDKSRDFARVVDVAADLDRAKAPGIAP